MKELRADGLATDPDSSGPHLQLMEITKAERNGLRYYNTSYEE